MYDNTIGAMLIGSLVGSAIWGVICVQTYDYFTANQDDLLQRSIVAMLWAISALLTIMDSETIYFYTVTYYGNPKGLVTPIWSRDAHSLVLSISNFIVRTMYARRVYQLGGKKSVVVTSWIVFISASDLVVMTAFMVKLYQGYAPGVLIVISKLFKASLVLGLAADLSVTVALCWYLQRAKTGSRRSDTLVNVLMAYVVHTGLLVTVISTVVLILYSVLPYTANLIFSGFYMLLGKLYVSAYLASLNSRKRLRGLYSDVSIRTSQFGQISRSRISQQQESKSQTFHNIAISLETTVDRKVDGIPDDETKIPSRSV